MARASHEVKRDELRISTLEVLHQAPNQLEHNCHQAQLVAFIQDRPLLNKIFTRANQADHGSAAAADLGPDLNPVSQGRGPEFIMAPQRASIRSRLVCRKVAHSG